MKLLLLFCSMALFNSPVLAQMVNDPQTATPEQILNTLKQAVDNEQTKQAVRELTQTPQQTRQQINKDLDQHSQQLEDAVSKQTE